jgi:hypothetical protein
MEEAGDINFFKKDEKAPEVVLLKGPLDNCNGKSLTNMLYNHLIKNKIDCKIITGIVVNDIMNEGNEYGIPGILIEFNEQLLENINRFKYICKIITNSLNIFS